MADPKRLWDVYSREAPPGANFIIYFSRRAQRTVANIRKRDSKRAEALWESIRKLYFEQNWPPGNPNSSLKIRTCGRDSAGLTVYKFRGDHRHIRGYFRVIWDPEEAELPLVLVDDLTSSHDEDDALRERVLSRVVSAEEIADVVLPVTPDKSSLDVVPGPPDSDYRQVLNVGPEEMDSALAWLESSANIIPSPRQLESIYSPTPILINGQAGTGKTSILAVRIAWVVAWARAGGKAPRLLVTAYSQKVVDMLRDQVDSALQYKHRKLGRAEGDGLVEFRAFPEILRGLLPPSQQKRFENRADRVGFGRFNREFFQNERKYGRFRGLSPELTWHVVRSLLKGWREDGPLGLEDFFGPQGSSTVPKKLTSDVPKDDLAEIMVVEGKYEAWLRSNGCYDDMDLAIAAWRSVKASPPSRFDEIYLDEAQDLTRVEFRVLESLIRPGDVLPSEGIPFALAGDPLQTINPTGFNWAHIGALFYRGRAVRKTDLELNQRTPQPIVDLANAVLRRRRYYSREPIVEQRAREQKGRKPACYQISGQADASALQDLLRHPRPGTALVCWVEDEADLIRFVQEDEHLRPVLEDIHGAERLASVLGGKTTDLTLDQVLASVRLHTVPDIKGLEFERVILYKIASSPRFAEFADATVADAAVGETLGSRLPTLYHLNRLYISVTRPTRHLFLFDYPDAVERVWRKIPEIDSTQADDLRSLPTDPALAGDDDHDWVADGQKYLQLYHQELDPRMLAYAEDCLERAPQHAVAQALLFEVRAERLERSAQQAARRGDREEAKKQWAEAGENWSRLGVERTKAARCFAYAEDWAEVRRVLGLQSVRSPELEGWYLYAELMCASADALERPAIELLSFLLTSPRVELIPGAAEQLSGVLLRLGRLDEMIALHERVLWKNNREDTSTMLSLVDRLERAGKLELVVQVLVRNGLQGAIPGPFARASRALAESARREGKWESAGAYWAGLADSGAEQGRATESGRFAAECYSELALEGNSPCWRQTADWYAKSDQAGGASATIAEAEDAARVGNLGPALRGLYGALPSLNSATGPIGRVYNEDVVWARLTSWAENAGNPLFYRDPDALSVVVSVRLHNGSRQSAKSLLERALQAPGAREKERILERLVALELEDSESERAIGHLERAGEITQAWELADSARATLPPRVLARVEGRYLARQFTSGNSSDASTIEKAVRLLMESGQSAEAESLRQFRIEHERDPREKVRLILATAPSVDSFIQAATALNSLQGDDRLSDARASLLRVVADYHPESDEVVKRLQQVLTGWLRDSVMAVSVQGRLEPEGWGRVVEYCQDDLAAKAYYQAASAKYEWARLGFKRVLGRLRYDFRLLGRTDPAKLGFVAALDTELAEMERRWKDGSEVAAVRTDADLTLMREKLSAESVSELRERWKRAGLLGGRAATKEVLVEGYIEYWGSNMAAES